MDIFYNPSWSLAGSSLKCYSCKSKLSNSQCQEMKNCSGKSMCKTEVISKSKWGWATHGGAVLLEPCTAPALGAQSSPPYLDTPAGMDQQSPEFIRKRKVIW